MAERASWGVVMTADEPLPLVAAFVAHYLSLGASEIHVFLDRPDDPARDLLADLPGVHVVLCDDAHWARFKGRPPVHVRRQQLNANMAYARCGAEWLLHCDADEFLAPDLDIAEELAALPDTCRSMNVPVGERVFVQDVVAPARSVFDGSVVWALPSKPWTKPLFGDRAPFLLRGMTAHIAGKSFTRTGRDLFVAIHLTKHLGEDGWADHSREVRIWPSRRSRLVHFDGLTPLHWSMKLLKKAQTQPDREVLTARLRDHRMAQIDLVSAAGASAASVSALFERLRRLPPDLCARLQAIGHFSGMPVDPATRVRERFGTLDLSVAGFDALLAERDPETAAEFGVR